MENEDPTMHRAANESDVSTFADVLHALGDVPPARVLHKPYPATEGDVSRLADREPKRLCELIDGVLVEKAMGLAESAVAAALIRILGWFVVENRLGTVTGEAGTVRLFAGRVRIPDVSFFSRQKLPGGTIPVEPIPSLAPDLAVEILSEANRPGEMSAKRDDYFSAGVRLYWEINPRTRTADVNTNVISCKTIGEGDRLTGGDVLPGFSVRLGDLFADL
jgi:Uma2 family endonuclease